MRESPDNCQPLIDGTWLARMLARLERRMIRRSKVVIVICPALETTVQQIDPQARTVLLRRNDGVSMSIGVASLFVNRPGGADQLVAMADAALYQAKDTGRNKIVMAPAPQANAA